MAEAARADKEATYSEFARGGRCRLVVLAVETGGRLSTETVVFLQQLAEAKSLSAPGYLRASTAAAFFRRWTRLLAVSVVVSHSESLLAAADSVPSAEPCCQEPCLLDFLTEARAAPVLEDVARAMPCRPYE